MRKIPKKYILIFSMLSALLAGWSLGKALADYQKPLIELSPWFYLEPGEWEFEAPGIFFKNTLNNQEFNWTLNDSAPQIQEQDNAYVVRVPLKNESQIPDVNVEVQPHEIRLTGKTVNKNPDGSVSTSSFFKSISTAAELDTAGFTRKIKDKELIIIIPKKSEITKTKLAPQLPDEHFI